MTDTSDRLQEALAALDAEPGLWMPEPGERVAGEVVGFATFTTRYGEKRTVVLEDLDSGQRLSIRLDYAVLQQEVERRDPQLGDMLVVRRNDDQQGPRGRYRHYSVAVVPADVAQGQAQ